MSGINQEMAYLIFNGGIILANDEASYEDRIWG